MRNALFFTVIVILLSLFLSSAPTLSAEDTEKERYAPDRSAPPPEGYVHRPFLEFFTGLSCPSCMGDSPNDESPDKAVHDAYLRSREDESVPFTTVTFHQLNGNNIDDLRTDGSEERMRYYQPGLSGTPDVEIDGGYIELGGFSTSQKAIDESNLDWALSTSETRYDDKPLRPLERAAWSFPYIRLEVDQIFDGESFFVEGKIVYDGNAKTLGALPLRGSLRVFMVEDNVTAYSYVYDENGVEDPYVINDNVFRGYAIENEQFTLNNRGEYEFNSRWSIPDAKVPVKTQDVYAVAAVFDTEDTTSAPTSQDGNMKGVYRCLQSATSRSTAYDRQNRPPEVVDVKLEGNTVTVSMDDEGGIAQAYVFYNTEAANSTEWEIAPLTLSGEELCDDAGVCYAYSDAMGTADLENSGEELYIQVLAYDDMKAQGSSAVFSFGDEGGSAKEKGSSSLISLGGTTLLMIGISFIVAGPLLYMISKNRKGGLFRLLSSKPMLALLVAVGMVITIFGVSAIVRTDTDKVPDFTVTDTDGNVHTPEDYDGKVLVLDIMFADCVFCKKEMPDVVDVYEHSKGKYGDDVEFLTVSILESDTDKMLDDFQNEYGATWPIGKNGDFPRLFDAAEVPKMVIIAPNGDIAYTHRGVIDPEEVKDAIKEAHEGNYDAVTITQTGSSLIAIGALAAVFGAITFFSPCSFPMLPGYLTYYMTQDTMKRSGKRTNPMKGGLVAGLGIVTFFLLIGILVAIFGAVIQAYLGYLMPVIGALLIVLGLLTLAGMDSFLERLMDLVKSPFEKLASGIRGSKNDDQENGTGGLYAYGFGYGAAASSCMAPAFIGVILLGFTAGGLIGGAIVFLLYSATLGTMMVIFSIIAAGGSSSLQKLVSSTSTVKKLSGALLMFAGGFVLFYFFYGYKLFGSFLSF